MYMGEGAAKMGTMPQSTVPQTGDKGRSGTGTELTNKKVLRSKPVSSPPHIAAEFDARGCSSPGPAPGICWGCVDDVAGGASAWCCSCSWVTLPLVPDSRHRRTGGGAVV